MDKIEVLQKMIDEAKKIVFFGGAGVSTESGIKDFRSSNGLYTNNRSVSDMLSHSFFLAHTKEFFDFYRKVFDVRGIKPNVVHKYLVDLEKSGKLKAIVTQNVDNLHTLACSSNVLELHGNVMRNYCMNCRKSYDGNYVFLSNGIPKCECGGIIKPDVVLYEEPLDDNVLHEAIEKIKEADLLIVAGTSLVVYPAAGLIRYFSGKNLVIINKDVTEYDKVANLVVSEKLGDVFSKLHI